MIIKIVKNMRNVLNVAKEKSKVYTCIKIMSHVGLWWFTPVILATWEAEIERTVV
jgi:hypothetical protein